MTRRKKITLGMVLLSLALVYFLHVGFTHIRDLEGWSLSANSLNQIAAAMRSYHEDNGHLPPAVVYDKEGKPLYSWRVLLLPYLEQHLLFEKFKLDEPWDSPHNKQFLEPTPRCYLPLFYIGEEPGFTRYQIFVGPGTAFERNKLTWKDFPDSLEETLLVVEAAEPVPWSKPVDLTYDPRMSLPALECPFTKPVVFHGYVVGHKSGFNATFADGKSRFISNETDETILRALVTRNDVMKIDLSRTE